ncbi:RHS repeat-associated core domain-containing protein [Porphyromonas gulae]|uniref:RHS repeat-associated core domain-containing protein n=1 Tax=Porphyromonas gulae TaxID=111105 RepID=UPI0009BA6AAB
MYTSDGEKTWSAELDIYGCVRNFAGRSLSDCPFRYQGQYEDEETGLYYNRFRYYDPKIGNYLSQDPIGLAGGNPTLYIYVFDSNTEIDPFGLRKYIVYQAPELDAMGKPTGRFYTGRTSGADEISVEQILTKRKSGHHRKDIGELISVYETDSYKAVRGGEQHYIEEARKSGKAVDQINGISPKKANKNGYEAAFVNLENNKTGILDNNLTKGHH